MEKTLKTTIVILLILIVGLFVALGYRQYTYTSLKHQSAEVQAYMQAEKDSIRTELLGLRKEYDQLQTDNDSMLLKLDLQKAKIDKLLKFRANSLWEIHKYKKEMSTLRDILKSYVVQIDSLNRLNQELISENQEVKTKLTEVEKQKIILEEEKKHLSSKVEKAEVLAAKNISAAGINKKSKEKDEIDKIEKIRVCFTIRENPVAKSGDRTIYIRIIRPDDAVLTKSKDNIFNVEGTNIVYSEKRVLNYQNKDIDMCIYYETSAEELIAGEYIISLYSEGKIIGSTSLDLKEGGFLGL